MMYNRQVIDNTSAKVAELADAPDLGFCAGVHALTLPHNQKPANISTYWFTVPSLTSRERTVLPTIFPTVEVAI